MVFFSKICPSKDWWNLVVSSSGRGNLHCNVYPKEMIQFWSFKWVAERKQVENLTLFFGESCKFWTPKDALRKPSLLVETDGRKGFPEEWGTRGQGSLHLLRFPAISGPRWFSWPFLLESQLHVTSKIMDQNSKKGLLKCHWLFSVHEPLVPPDVFWKKKFSTTERWSSYFLPGEVSSADPSGHFRKRCWGTTCWSHKSHWEDGKGMTSGRWSVICGFSLYMI